MVSRVPKKTLLIKAVPYRRGGRKGYCLKTEDGEYPQEGDIHFIHSSRASAYRDAAAMWPPNSVWRGRKVKGGYRININF